MRQHTLATLLLGIHSAAALSLPSFLFGATDAQRPLAPPDEPVGLPVAHPTASFWTDSPGANPLAAAGSTGPLTPDADVCIIGAGMTGVAVAYHLARLAAPPSIAILEARDFCSGATGRNGGHLTPHVFRGYSEYAARYGAAEAARSFALERHTADAMVRVVRAHGLAAAVDLVDGGHIDLFASPADEARARADYAAAARAGVAVAGVEWLAAEHVNATYGAARAGVRTRGHNFWPLKFVAHLFGLANATAPIALHTRTPVTAVTALAPHAAPAARRWQLHTPRGALACGRVVHATNAHAAHLLPPLRGAVVPTRGQVAGVRAAAPAAAGGALGGASWADAAGYWFARPAPAGRAPLVVLGGGRGARHGVGDADDGVLDARAGRWLRAHLPRVFPRLFAPGRAPEWEWTGIMGFTAQGDPFVGPVLDADGGRGAYAGQFVAAGYSGHGMPRAFGSAEALAQMIAAERAGAPWHAPAWLPERYLTWRRPTNATGSL